MEIVVESNLKDVADFLDRGMIQAVQKAVARSLSRTFTGLKTDLTKTIRTQRLVNSRTLPLSRIKQKYLRERSRISASTPLAQMEARLSISDRRPGLSNFFAKRVTIGRSKIKKRPLYGVRVTVMGKSYTAGRAFIPKGKQSPVLARTTSKRYPLRVLSGPSFAIMVSKLGIATRMQSLVRERYSREFNANLNFFLSQKKKAR